jgi:V8-like Glu-specific endopeptidase
MGSCDCLKKNKRIDQVETINPLNEVDLNLIEVFPSVCKVKVKNLSGTGFFIKLYINNKELFCILTNEHVIKEEFVESNEKIIISYEYEKKYNKIKLNQSERFIKCNKDLDVTIIEIIKSDNVEDKYFLIPNLDNNFVNQEMYVAQYPGGILKYSKGKIKEIDDYELTHNASTTFGSSGSPICLKGTTKVIGIHKQGNKEKIENYGTLIHPII